MARVQRRNNAYFVLAIGYLCISINFYLNGMGIILPTFVGYILLAKGSYLLRVNAKIFLYAVIPAVIMAIMTFPHILIEYATGAPLYIFWPMEIMAYAIIILHGVGIYQCSVLNNSKQIRFSLVVLIIILLLSRTLWYLASTISVSVKFTFILYEAPKWLFAYILYLCYKKFVI